MTAYIGVDPGLSGALSIIYPTGEIKTLPTPVAGKEIDVNAIVKWIDNVLPVDLMVGRYPAIAYIEAVHAFSGQGVVSMFKFGFVTGVIHGILRALSIPLYTVTPQAWKKEILAGTAKDKQAAIDYVLRAYPNVSLFRTEKSRTYDNGIADSICIAEYGRRKHNV
jgi:hypothetical protein